MSKMALTSTIPRFYLPRPGRLMQFIKARLYAPEMDLELVRHITDQFDLELMDAPQNLPFGWRNNNIIIVTSNGKKVLKQYRDKWAGSAIAYEHSILGHLQRHQFMAPRLVTTTTNETMVQINGRFYALFDFIEGQNFAGSYLSGAQRQKLLHIAGKTLARLHQQLTDFEPQGQHHLGFESLSGSRGRDLDWHLQQLRQLPEKSKNLDDPQANTLGQQLSQRVARVSERLSQLDPILHHAPLPKLVIHGDYGIHNLLFHTDGTATVHDFELARLEWRLVDLVIVLSRLQANEYQTFMNAYQQEFPLTDIEWQLWPQVWQYYRLCGAVQYWHNYFVYNGRYRLQATVARIEEAVWAGSQGATLCQLKKGQPQSPRILMVVRLFYPWIGGTERQAHKLSLKLAEKQIDVQITTGWWFRGTPQQETLDGIPIFRNQTLWEFFGIKGMRKFGGYLYMITLLWHLWRQRATYDIIHVHGLNYHTFTAVLAAKWFKRKTIVKLANSGRASDVNKMRHNKQLALAEYMLPTALQCDRFVALNKKVVQELTAVNVPQTKIIELANGVEIDAITPKSNYEVSGLARLVFVGRLHPQKGLDTLFQAVAQLVKTENFVLELIGDGPEKATLKNLAQQLGITSHIIFHGQSNQVIPLIQGADIFLLPSRAEGLSNALLEAMACALPVIVSNIPGNVDVIKDHQNGLLFTVEDPHSLAENISLLLQQPPLRQQLGQAARETVQTQYSLDYVADRYIALYQDLLVEQEGMGIPQLAQQK